MKLFKSIIFFTILGLPVLGTAQENPKHPIDVALDKCLKVTKGNLPRAKCYSNASEAWEKAVDADYQKLMKQLSPELQKALKNEQDSWVKYREANQDFVMAKYGKRRGTGYISVRIVLLMEPNKARALQLEDRFED